MSYFLRRLSAQSPAHTTAAVKQLAGLPAHVSRQKRQLLNKYRLGANVGQIAKMLGFCVWWQDLRKYYIFLANHHITLFAREASRRYRVPLADLFFYSAAEFGQLLLVGRRITAAEIRRRHRAVAVYYREQNNARHYLSGVAAEAAIRPFLAKRAGKAATVLSGLVVSVGKTVVAPVCVITSGKQLRTMKRGAVLVAPMTAPDYVVAMRKASAIITDEGGMTSHTAIVARELRVPCIVGTRIATTVLKNGDMVEVNTSAGNGTVKKIGRS